VPKLPDTALSGGLDDPPVRILQARGQEPGLFCIAGLDAYQELADALAPDLPVYGVFLPYEQTLFAQRRRGRPREQLSVSEVAAGYLAAVRERQPAGPYRLLGFSFAGVVVYEMAQQLARAGESVQLLVMLDIWLPSAVNAHPLRARISHARSLSSPDRRRARYERFRERIVLDAIDRYETRRYAGAVLLIRAQDSVTSLGRDLVDPSYGWARHVAALEIADVPGNHLGILRSPSVGALASEVRASGWALRPPE
jgi:thioesterase domain-containing protein